MRLSLKILVPLVIMGTALILVSYLFYLNLAQIQKQIEEEGFTVLHQSMTRTQGTLEYLLRIDDLVHVQEEIAALGSDHDLQQAVLAGIDGAIIASIHVENRGKNFNDYIERLDILEWKLLTETVSSAKNTLHSRLWFDADRDGIFAIFPILISNEGTWTNTENVGILFAYQDLARRKSALQSLLLKQTATVAIPVVLIALFTSWMLQIFVIRHIKRLADATIDLSEGRYVPAGGFDGKDEISILYRSFDEMAHKISDARQALQTEVDRVQLLMDSAAEGIYGIDSKGVCTFINRSALEMLGFSHANDVVGDKPHKVIHHSYPDGSHYPEADCQIYRASHANHYMHEDKEVFWKADGRSFPVEYWSYPILMNDKVVGAVVTFLDISDRVAAQKKIEEYRLNLEEKVRERTLALEASNRELEAFSYSVSHDLRTPLRGIDGFSQILIEDYSDDLDSKGIDCLNRIRSASQRLGDLIDDLLRMARISRAKKAIEPVSLSELAQEITQQLREQDTEMRSITINIDNNMRVTGDHDLLRVLLDNLLGNAWKYTSGKDKALIHFGVQSTNSENVFFVHDNGAGFDMRFYNKLFEPFQRLHGSDFKGNGIGLATARRVVDLHGGNIWAESKIGAGTTFYFTLPSEL